MAKTPFNKRPCHQLMRNKVLSLLRARSFVTVLAAAALLTDCAGQPTQTAPGSAIVSTNAISSAVVSSETQQLTAAEISQGHGCRARTRPIFWGQTMCWA